VTGLPPLIDVIDDDESVRESLPDLLTAFGYRSRTYSSAEEFLSSAGFEAQCLILDVAMPGMTGPELQEELARSGRSVPIIFVTAQKDEGLRPSLVERGAVACLFKPFSDTELLLALGSAFQPD
jgi:FixJ family two-component response regulator